MGQENKDANNSPKQIWKQLCSLVNEAVGQAYLFIYSTFCMRILGCSRNVKPRPLASPLQQAVEKNRSKTVALRPADLWVSLQPQTHNCWASVPPLSAELAAVELLMEPIKEYSLDLHFRRVEMGPFLCARNNTSDDLPKRRARKEKLSRALF